MATTYKEAPGWTFVVDEVSMAIYRVTGRDQTGHIVERIGLDSDVLLNECKADAIQVIGETKKGRLPT